MNNQKLVQNIAIGAIVFALIAGIAFVLFRSGLLSGENSAATPTPQTTSTPTSEVNSATTSGTPTPRLTFGSPVGSPRATVAATATPKVTAMPISQQCSNLIVNPSEGTAPLSVRFSVSGMASFTQIKEFEFDFGDGAQPVKQSGNSVNHTYTKAGVYTAILRARDSQGKAVSFSTNECRRNVVVKEKPEATGSSKPTTNLPNTGFPIWAWVLFSSLIFVAGFKFATSDAK